MQGKTEYILQPNMNKLTSDYTIVYIKCGEYYSVMLDVGRHQGWVFIDVLFSMDEHTLAELSLPISPAQNIDVESQVIIWQCDQGHRYWWHQHLDVI